MTMDAQGLPGLSADEILDVVDEHDRVVGQAPGARSTPGGCGTAARSLQVRDAEGRIFVHRRTAQKLIFPSRYDMFVGGVLGAGETYDAAALRERRRSWGCGGFSAPGRCSVPLRVGGVRRQWWSGWYDGAVRPGGQGRRCRRWPGIPFLAEDVARKRGFRRWDVGAGRAGGVGEVCGVAP
ncbi:hypothetical protein GCM10020221_00970 [Streptomyces thioluteus]|uniref:Nudix hydrolase domain-containing protein n=1 Tax=Streptomyces thioluteus TaxID=66431 RepID=A0ABP6IT14_STRTU